MTNIEELVRPHIKELTPYSSARDEFEGDQGIFLEGEGLVSDDIYIDRSFPEENKPTRKPGTELLTKYIHGNYDLENSYIIGDRKSDVQLAKNLGSKSIFINDESYDTNKLYQSGLNRVAQNVGEEAVELVIEAKDDNIDRFKNEAADLLYHLLILLKTKDISFEDIEKMLEERSK